MMSKYVDGQDKQREDSNENLTGLEKKEEVLRELEELPNGHRIWAELEKLLE